MTKKGKDDPNGEDEVIEFESLETDEDKDEINKVTKMVTFLKEKLSDEDYTEAMKHLGVKTELSTEELLGAILQELQKKKPDEDEEEDLAKKKPDEDEEEDEEKKAAAKKEDEYEYPEDKTKKGADPSYKDFMRECMGAGKSMGECSAEFRKKYPAPSKKEESEFADGLKFPTVAAKPAKTEDSTIEKELADLKLDLARIKEEKRLSDITHKVEKQIDEKHLAPVQRDAVIKLMAKMEDGLHEEYLGTFASQKFKVFEDKGQTKVVKPGAAETIDEETRKRLMKEFDIGALIDEKGVKRRNN